MVLNIFRKKCDSQKETPFSFSVIGAKSSTYRQQIEIFKIQGRSVNPHWTHSENKINNKKQQQQQQQQQQPQQQQPQQKQQQQQQLQQQQQQQQQQHNNW